MFLQLLNLQIQRRKLLVSSCLPQNRLRAIAVQLGRLVVNWFYLDIVVLIGTINTVKGLKYLLFESFHRSDHIVLRSTNTILSFKHTSNFLLMCCSWHGLNFLWVWLLQTDNIENLTILFETVLNTGMILLIFKHFIKKIINNWSKCFIIVLSISVDSGILMLKGSFITIEWYLFDWFIEIRQIVITINLKELNEFLLLKGRND